MSSSQPGFPAGEWHHVGDNPEGARIISDMSHTTLTILILITMTPMGYIVSPSGTIPDTSV